MSQAEMIDTMIKGWSVFGGVIAFVLFWFWLLGLKEKKYDKHKKV